jgi:hypothetical protein
LKAITYDNMALFRLKPLFDERDLVDQTLSLDYCNSRFGMYGKFCTFPLRASAIASGEYDNGRLEMALTTSAYDGPAANALQKYIRNLDFDDCGLFTVHEYRLLIQLEGPCSPLTNAQLDADEDELLYEQCNGAHMLKSHAEILLKALKYWRLRYHEKYEEWVANYNAVVTARHMRRLLELRLISPIEAAKGRILEDDGYSSE